MYFRNCITVIFILIASTCFGAININWVESGDETSFCDCSGDVTFCWEITTNDLDITNSGGCSDGDTTATPNSDAALELNPNGPGYAIYIPSTYDYFSFDVISQDLISSAEGTITFDIYHTSWTASRALIGAIGVFGEDELYFGTSLSTGIYSLIYEGANAGPIEVTSSNVINLNEWVSVTIKWRLGTVDPSLSITVNDITDTNNTDLTTWVNPETSFTLGGRAGSSGGNVVYLKNIKVYNSWQ